MDANKIMLLSQLINSMDDNFSFFDDAYKSNNKEKFDVSKKAILELHRKIDYMLNL